MRYFIFLLFNHYYKDGNYKNGDMPYFTAILMLMIYEIFLLFTLIAVMDHLLNLSVSYKIASLKRLSGFTTIVLLYPLNHYYFITKGGFDTIYNNYKTAKMNTKRNRIIYGTILILILVALFVLICNLKSLLS